MLYKLWIYSKKAEYQNYEKEIAEIDLGSVSLLSDPILSSLPQVESSGSESSSSSESMISALVGAFLRRVMLKIQERW